MFFKHTFVLQNKLNLKDIQLKNKAFKKVKKKYLNLTLTESFLAKYNLGYILHNKAVIPENVLSYREVNTTTQNILGKIIKLTSTYFSNVLGAVITSYRGTIYNDCMKD